jgi:putative phosphonate catabolism associated alcohol dehydrogenase
MWFRRRESIDVSLPRHARAAVFVGVDRPLELRELPLAEPAAGELLVRVSACTLCGSDLHTVTGRRSAVTPLILGHEILGRIEAFGNGTSRIDLSGAPLTEGDRVTWTIAASCGGCFFCEHELPQKCETLHKYGHARLEPAGHWSGGLAEYCLLRPGTGVLRVPEALPDELACPANCATATVAGLFRLAGDVCDKTVLVQGAGLLGLTACALAAWHGAESILCVEPNAARRELALDFGATIALDGNPAELREAVLSVTGNHGVDVAFELTGSEAAFASAWPVLRTGATYLLAGAVRPLPPVGLDLEQLVRRCLTIRGQHNYAPRDLVAAIRFLDAARERFPWAKLSGGRFALTQINEAFLQAQQPGAGRVLVVP